MQFVKYYWHKFVNHIIKIPIFKLGSNFYCCSYCRNNTIYIFHMQINQKWGVKLLMGKFERWDDKLMRY